jgi:hypothetical protein
MADSKEKVNDTETTNDSDDNVNGVESTNDPYEKVNDAELTIDGKAISPPDSNPAGLLIGAGCDGLTASNVTLCHQTLLLSLRTRTQTDG